MSEDAIAKGLVGVAHDLNKEFKARVAVTGDELCVSDVPFRVPTNSFLLNRILGGGVPIGRVMEIFGDPSHGKSTLVEEMMIGFQQYPGISVLLDADTGWARHRAEAMGHNSQRHLHLQADTVERGFDTIQSTIARLRMPGRFPPSMPVGIFWDTISASQTEGEKEGDRYKEGMGDKPRKVREKLRVIAPELPRNNVALVFVSHTHVEIGKGQKKGPPKKKASSGGDAIPFWSAKRIKVWVSSAFHNPYRNAGIITSALTVKDKLEAPNLLVELPILHKTGIDAGYELVNYLLDNSTWVNMNGAYVQIPDFPEPGKALNFYPSQLHKKLEHFPELLDYLKLCAENAWAENEAT